MSLGIIPELEEACTPRDGEFVVGWVDWNSETVGVSLDGWKIPCRTVAFEDVRTRLFNRPSYPPSVGDIVRIAEDA